MKKSSSLDKGALLITPPKGLWKDKVEKPWISTQPLGLAYIAAGLREAGIKVEMMDAYSLGLSGMDIRRKLEETNPAVVGVSSLTPQWPDTEIVMDLIKDYDKNILTVVGGPHVTALPEESVANSNVDVAVIGEGEGTIVEICQAALSGSDLKDVDGIAVRSDGQIIRTKEREKNKKLDQIPFPAHDLLPEPSFYNPFPAWGKSGNFSCMISGRGCPYSCSFCDVTEQQGKRYRLRSAENVVSELKWLYQAFKVKTFSFRDPSVICNRRRLLEICRLIKDNDLNIVWTCSSRANEVDYEMLEAMKDAGCRRVQYGIEVGNTEMLKEIKKVDKERVIEAVRDTRKAGISAHGYFLFGFVEETPETIQETIDFAKELELDSAGFGVMVPFPGTQEYDKYKELGLLLSEDWRDYDVMGKPVYRHKNISNEQLARAPKIAYRSFYMRPKIIARHLGKMTSFRTVYNYLRSAKLMFN